VIKVKDKKESFSLNFKKLTAYGEKAAKQLQGSFKQLFKKATALAKATESKAKGGGNLVKGKGIFSLVKSRWYYFALIMIIFASVMPYLPAKGMPNLTTLVQMGQRKVTNQGPTITLEDVEDTLDSEEPGGLPGDLFNEQEARNIAIPAAKKETVSAPNQTNENQSEAEEQKQPAAMPQISLTWPVTGEIVLDYGLGYSKAYGDYRFNPGLNLASQENVQVKAAASGKVLAVEENLLYNKYLVIEHPGGFTTLYGNLAQVGAAIGDQVEKGALVGKVGQPGYHSLGIGVNLFFQVKQGEQTVDPKEYLSR
jgi:murein DD-endopeptidase MepM/ murein hydrolase activator NlpD